MATTCCFVLVTLPRFSVLCVQVVWTEFCSLASHVCWPFMKDKLASFSCFVLFFLKGSLQSVERREGSLSWRAEDWIVKGLIANPLNTFVVCLIPCCLPWILKAFPSGSIQHLTVWTGSLCVAAASLWSAVILKPCGHCCVKPVVCGWTRRC